MATEFVTIKHPDLENTGRASRQAFEEVWKDKGFELVEDEEEAVQTTTAPEESSTESTSRSTRRSRREGNSGTDED